MYVSRVVCVRMCVCVGEEVNLCTCVGRIQVVSGEMDW